ncbi:MAG: hypothetical protein GXP04_04105 [Alphaproteobacteria bacterium]|nr:hypothetical protein [Alphaproteobacteria bacterium]
MLGYLLATLAFVNSTVSEKNCFESADLQEVLRGKYDCSALKKADEVFIAAANGFPQFVVIEFSDPVWRVRAYGWKAEARSDGYIHQTRFVKGVLKTNEIEGFRADFLAGIYNSMTEQQPPNRDIICIDSIKLMVYAKSLNGKLSGSRASCLGKTKADDFAGRLRAMAILVDPEMQDYLFRIGKRP